MNYQSKTNLSGITLVELLVVVAIVAILSTIAVPSLEGFLVRSRHQQAVSEFVTALTLARSEAVKRGMPITMAATDAKPFGFSRGWSIFVDASRAGVPPADPSDAIAVHQGFPPGKIIIERRGGGGDEVGGRPVIHFDGLGRLRRISGIPSGAGATSFTVAAYRSSTEMYRTAVCLNFAGRVRTISDKANNDPGGCGG